jgi:hypothetical protein
MFGLPKSTEISKQPPKKTLFDRFKPKLVDRRLFEDQISRMLIVGEISPLTVAIKAREDVTSIYIVLLILKTMECDKKNIVVLSKLINQHMVFAMQFADSVRLAVYKSGMVLTDDKKLVTESSIVLNGLDLEAI